MTFIRAWNSIMVVSRWLEQLDQSIRDKKLFRDGQSILVGVSGGLDSMVLLYALHKLANDHKWKLKVAHFNHKLRGPSSDADEQFVRSAAKRLRLPVVVGQRDVRRAASQTKISIEMAARNLRHSFFARVAGKDRIATVALAHHADDQVELFFLRLFRGAGGEGLGGMKWISPSPADACVSLVRPLLDQHKEDLCEFAREQAIQFCEDASNASIDIRRNRIRHELIPLLERYQPELKTVVRRTMEVIGRESDVVAEVAARWLEHPAESKFQSLPLAVQRRCVQLQLFALKQPVDFEIIERLREHPNTWIMTAPKLSVCRSEIGILKLRHASPHHFLTSQKKLVLNASGKAEFAGVQISWELAIEPGKKFFVAQNQEHFDAEKIGRWICLRHWLPGDRFQPIGASSPRKLQDLFTNSKIPQTERHRLLVATTSAGEIFWVQGLRIGERFKLQTTTRTRLKWRWALGG